MRPNTSTTAAALNSINDLKLSRRTKTKKGDVFLLLLLLFDIIIHSPFSNNDRLSLYWMNYSMLRLVPFFQIIITNFLLSSPKSGEEMVPL